MGSYANLNSGELNSPRATQRERALLFKAVAAWYTRHFFK